MDQYDVPLFVAAVFLCPPSGVRSPDHVPPTTDRQARFLAFSSVHRDAKIVQALSAQMMTAQEPLALSIGREEDGRSSLPDVLDAQHSAATSQASLVQAVQQKGDGSIVLNVAIGSSYNVDAAAIRPTSYDH